MKTVECGVRYFFESKSCIDICSASMNFANRPHCQVPWPTFVPWRILRFDMPRLVSLFSHSGPQWALLLNSPVLNTLKIFCTRHCHSSWFWPVRAYLPYPSSSQRNVKLVSIFLRMSSILLFVVMSPKDSGPQICTCSALIVWVFSFGVRFWRGALHHFARGGVLAQLHHRFHLAIFKVMRPRCGCRKLL